MPDAKDNRKMSGDIRPPADPAPFAPEELKEANLGADGTPHDRGQATGGREDETKPGRGINQPGYLKETGEQERQPPGSEREGQSGSDGER
jgi:hypothetical protein